MSIFCSTEARNGHDDGLATDRTINRSTTGSGVTRQLCLCFWAGHPRQDVCSRTDTTPTSPGSARSASEGG